MRCLLWIVCCLAVLLCTARSYAQQDDSPPQASSQEDKEARRARAAEESSSKDTRIDLNPPNGDAKNHPMSGVAISDAQESAYKIQELHPWDPHKAAKDVEVGDYYFRRKNYKAAIERYKDALVYKPNDAVAQFRLGESLAKTGNSGEATTHYQEYLKILPHGPFAADAQRALQRLKANEGKGNTAAN
jgi:tetratricopeptide (TPR) repeat protein